MRRRRKVHVQAGQCRVSASTSTGHGYRYLSLQALCFLPWQTAGRVRASRDIQLKSVPVPVPVPLPERDVPGLYWINLLPARTRRDKWKRWLETMKKARMSTFTSVARCGSCRTIGSLGHLHTSRDTVYLYLYLFVLVLPMSKSGAST